MERGSLECVQKWVHCSDSQYNHLKQFRMKLWKATAFTVSDLSKDWQHNKKNSCYITTTNIHVLWECQRAREWSIYMQKTAKRSLIHIKLNVIANCKSLIVKVSAKIIWTKKNTFKTATHTLIPTATILSITIHPNLLFIFQQFVRLLPLILALSRKSVLSQFPSNLRLTLGRDKPSFILHLLLYHFYSTDNPQY